MGGCHLSSPFYRWENRSRERSHSLLKGLNSVSGWTRPVPMRWAAKFLFTAPPDTAPCSPCFPSPASPKPQQRTPACANRLPFFLLTSLYSLSWPVEGRLWGSGCRQAWFLPVLFLSFIVCQEKQIPSSWCCDDSLTGCMSKASPSHLKAQLRSPFL